MDSGADHLCARRFTRQRGSRTPVRRVARPVRAIVALSRDGRTSCWASPQGRRRVVVTILPHEYKAHPSDAGGLIGEALTWDGQVQRLQPDNTWHATPPRLTGRPTLTTKPSKKFRRSA